MQIFPAPFAETEEGIEEVEQPLPQPTHHPQIPTTTKKIQPPPAPKYDPMKDEPPPAIITPSYVPLWKKNEHWGDQCEPAVMCAELDFIRIYSQNNNDISDSTGLKYDDTFKNMKEADADIFCIIKTHADKMNAKNNRVLESSCRRMFQSKERQYCNLVSSSSIAPITKYARPGGNMMGISGPLVSRMRRQIKDKYG